MLNYLIEKYIRRQIDMTCYELADCFDTINFLSLNDSLNPVLKMFLQRKKNLVEELNELFLILKELDRGKDDQHRDLDCDCVCSV